MSCAANAAPVEKDRDECCQICESKPFCLCVGHVNEWDECSCVALDRTAKRSVCIGCSAPMVLIDFETGEPVP